MGIVCSKSVSKKKDLRRRGVPKRAITVNRTYAGPIRSGSSSRTSGQDSHNPQANVLGDGESKPAAVHKSKMVVLDRHSRVYLAHQYACLTNEGDVFKLYGTYSPNQLFIFKTFGEKSEKRGFTTNLEKTKRVSDLVKKCKDSEVKAVFPTGFRSSDEDFGVDFFGDITPEPRAGYSLVTPAKDLFHWIECGNNNTSVKNRNAVFKQLCAGLSFLHKNNIVHGDIKPENILYKFENKEIQIKIIDFETCEKVGTRVEYFQGSLQWALPAYLYAVMTKSSFTIIPNVDWYPVLLIAYLMTPGLNDLHQFSTDFAEVSSDNYQFVYACCKTQENLYQKSFELNLDGGNPSIPDFSVAADADAFQASM